MSVFDRKRAVLALEDGKVFHGYGFGADGETSGEVVFNTSMIGYQEILTDPSYAGQIVTMTYPLIGNYGVNPVDNESRKPFARGFIVRESSAIYSNWRADGSLQEFMEKYGIVGIEGVDTRALTKHIRSVGALRGVIEIGGNDPEKAIIKAKNSQQMAGADLVKEVTVEKPYSWSKADNVKYKVVALDFGIKSNILSELLGKKPIFGICLGHQLLSLAIGGSTYKLKFGHRGGNQPVKNLLNGKVEITSQNHGFAVNPKSLKIEEKPWQVGETIPLGGWRGSSDVGDVEVTHINLNDGTVEGLQCLEIPAYSVQYHPEAAPGPHDARYLFDRFVDMMEGK
ncbi:MAG: carbamoyl-phosphate synthase small subunit [Rubrobacteridae bacterium]|nr:carbamoyl-phosphate synthase small subunit [Rubrobacteridae bacterium]